MILGPWKEGKTHLPFLLNFMYKQINSILSSGKSNKSIHVDCSHLHIIFYLMLELTSILILLCQQNCMYSFSISNRFCVGVIIGRLSKDLYNLQQ